LLWCTWPQLQEGIRVIAEWGFSYVTGFPWVKIIGQPQVDLWGQLTIRPTYGVGFWARGCTEMVLIGRRGQVSPPDLGWVGLLSPNYYHSRKPDNLYQYAESLPGPYLEMFARRARSGWDVYGNEAPDSIALSCVQEVAR
jgi:N6-adenosine-specific RNA methylase IME4